MFRLKLGIMLLCVLFSTGCATMIQVQIKRAPEINLAGVKSIKIEPFDVGGQLNFDYDTGHGGLWGAVAGMAVDAGVNKLAEAGRPGVQQAEWSGLKQKVFSDGFFQLREGSEYDALVTGTISYNVHDSGEVRAYKDGDGKITEYYELTRYADVRVKFTVTNHAGVVLGVSEVAGRASKMERDPDRNKARRMVPNWDVLVKEALRETEEPFLRKIAPYFVTENRTFENGESETLKEGNKAAGKGNWVVAAELWKKAQASGIPQDRIAALYNLGIYDEVESRLNEALAKFQEVYRLSGNGKYQNDIARIQARIQEDKQLRAISSTPEPPSVSAQESTRPFTQSANTGLDDSDPEIELKTWANRPGLKVAREKSMHRFNWTPLPEASGYHVYTSSGKSKAFKQLNHKLLVKPQLRAKALRRGKVWVKVAALDEEGNVLVKSTPLCLKMP